MQDRLNTIVAEVLTEVKRSIEKHGLQHDVPLGTGPDTFPLDPIAKAKAVALANWAKAKTDVRFAEGTITWADILTEEVFEAYAEDDPVKLRAELVQVAAVTVKMIELIDSQLQPGTKLGIAKTVTFAGVATFEEE